MVQRGINYLPYTLINKNQLNYNLYNHLKDLNYIEWEGINLYRAIKTDKEIKGIKRCHLADGIAMAKFWAWRAQQHQITEY
jgi:Xaa-Pro aminopeptidase